MKKLYISILVLTVFFVVTPMVILASCSGQSTNVADAKTLDDDTKVYLEGFIVEKLKDEFYLFRDDTGDIGVEIDEKLMKDMDIKPDQKVMIHGEIDRDEDTVYIEAKKVEIVKEKAD